MELSNESDLDLVDTAKQFYMSCLNDTIENENDAIKKLLIQIFHDYDNSDFNTLLSKINHYFGQNYLFSMQVDLDLENKLQNAIYVNKIRFNLFF